MKDIMLYLLMDPIVLQETIRSGKLPCGVPHGKSLKPRKEKVSQVSLQKWKPPN